MHRSIFFLILAIWFNGSSFARSEEGVFILPSEKGASLLLQCSRSTPQGIEGFWKPTESEIIDLERRLVPFLMATSSGASVLPLSNLRSQYVGFVKVGKRYIYGNFYTKRISRNDERTEPIIICDGGASFWGVMFSVERKEFLELAFNRVA